MRKYPKMAGKPILTFILAILSLVLLSTSTMAVFTNDYGLTYSSQPVNGSAVSQRMTWKASASKIGMAYVDTDSGTASYLEWDAASGVTLKNDLTSSAYTALGLAYNTGGYPCAGWVAGPDGMTLMETVKQSDGTWVTNNTGIGVGYYYNPGTYARNPSNDRGSFCINTEFTTNPSAKYIYYNGSTWTTNTLAVGGFGGGNSLAFSSTGTPYVAFLSGNSTSGTIKAGVASPANLLDITGSPMYEYLSQYKIAINPSNGEVWVAYVDTNWDLYVRKWNGSSWGTATVVDNNSSMNAGSYSQLGFAIAPNGDKAILYPILKDGDPGGLAMAFWDHNTSAWTVEALPQEGDVAGLDLLYTPAGTLYALYNAETGNQWHIMTGYTPPAPVYMKITMNNQTTPCTIHLFGTTGTLTFLPQCNIWEEGIHIDETSWVTPGNWLQGNEYTGWIDLGPLNLSSYGENMIQLYAIEGWVALPDGVSPANFTVKLSTTPSDTGLFKTLTKSGNGCGMTIVLNRTDLVSCKDDAAWSTLIYNTVNGLPSTPGSRPTLFPMILSTYVTDRIGSYAGSPGGDNYFADATRTNDINTLLSIGYNALGTCQYDSTYFANGLTGFGWSTNYMFAPYIIDGNRCNPDPVAIANYINSDYNNIVATGHADKLLYWTLYDEPSSPPMDHIVGCPICLTKFRTYLQKLGFVPADFGQTVWTNVYPSNDPVGQKKLYYYTVMYRGQIMVDLFKAGTDAINTLYPGKALSKSNFVDEVVFSGNMMSSGIDQWAIFDQKAQTLGWTENYLSYAISNQMTGFDADVMRAVTRPIDGKFGFYNVYKSYAFESQDVNWDSAADKLSIIGHGGDVVFDYEWGPHYALTVDSSSDDLGWPKYLQIGSKAVGAVENYLVNSRRDNSKIAILLSHVTDAFNITKNTCEYGKDICGLWLILTHLGYPVDILSEKDIAAGRLTTDGYKMLFCDNMYLNKKALIPLQNWVNTSGGILYMGPGALTYDETGTSLAFDTWAGISRAAYVYSAEPGGEIYNFKYLSDLMPVTYSGNALEALCGYQKMNSTPSGATVLATYSGDGTAAAWSKAKGAGVIKWCGFWPGLGYDKAAAITRDTRNAADPDFPTYGSTDYPQAYRNLIAALLSGLSFTDRVTTNNYLVEAARLESTSGTYPGSIIAVMNWTGQPVNGLQVNIPQNGRMGTATTVIHSITSQTVASGVKTVTFNMTGPIEFIKLLPNGNAPTVSITAPTAGSVTFGNSLNITANAADSGGAISKVDFYQGGVLLGTDTSSPYSYSWTSIPGGNYTLTAVATDSASNTTVSTPIAITIYNSADIGTVGAAGSASYNAGVFTVAGGGAGITGTTDAFRFVNFQTTENCTITARVVSFSSTLSGGRAGVMLRQNTATNSINAASLYCGASTKRVYFSRRTTAGGSTSSNNATVTAAPYWVRVSRLGNTVRAYRSPDGITWTQVGSNTTVTMTDPIQIGLAVTNGSTAAAATASFDNVTISKP